MSKGSDYEVGMDDVPTSLAAQEARTREEVRGIDETVPQHEKRKWKRRLTPEEVERNVSRMNAAEHRLTPGVENAKLEDALFGDGDPRYFLDKEKPEHRQMSEMKLAGFDIKEIAAALGYSPTMVSNVLRQPWARAYMLKQTKKTVQEEMREFLEGEVMPTLRKLAEVRDDDKSRKSDVINASNALLDRFLGKAVQPIVTESVDPEKLSSKDLELAAAKALRDVQSQAN